ncbi:MAG: TRAP transporter small permease subunit, partial [Candidatus Aenigmarchaeota archaeon]|nr:TRAP transporter small permease subunit [Candidatus Aenigmarchaeota archaeon]
LVVLLFGQVTARYLFNFSIFWSEEVARFVFIYLVFLGACTMARGREHI